MAAPAKRKRRRPPQKSAAEIIYAREKGNPEARKRKAAEHRDLLRRSKRYHNAVSTALTRDQRLQEARQRPDFDIGRMRDPQDQTGAPQHVYRDLRLAQAAQRLQLQDVGAGGVGASAGEGDFLTHGMVKDFQRRVGLPMTGVLDQDLAKLMSMDADELAPASDIWSRLDPMVKRLEQVDPLTATGKVDDLRRKYQWDLVPEVQDILYRDGRDAAREKIMKVTSQIDADQASLIRTTWPSIPAKVAATLAASGAQPEDPNVIGVAMMGVGYNSRNKLANDQSAYLARAYANGDRNPDLEKSPVWQDYRVRAGQAQAQQEQPEDGGGGGGFWDDVYDGLKTATREGFAALAAPYEEVQGVFRNTVAGIAQLPRTLDTLANTPSLAPGDIARTNQQSAVPTIEGITGTPQFGPQSQLGIQIEGAVGEGPTDMGEGFFPSPEAPVGRKQIRRANRALSIYGHAGTPGRLAAFATGLEPDDAAYNILSGVVDAGVAIYGDPANAVLAGLGRANQARKFFSLVEEGRNGAGLFQGVRKVFQSPTFERWLGSRRAKAVIDHLAENTDFEEARRIVGHSRTAAALTDATNADEVTDILRAVAGVEMPKIPTVPGLRTVPFAHGSWVPRLRRPQFRWLENAPNGAWMLSDRDQVVDLGMRMLKNAKVGAEEVSQRGYDLATARTMDDLQAAIEGVELSVIGRLTEKGVAQDEATEIVQNWHKEWNQVRRHAVDQKARNIAPKFLLKDDENVPTVGTAVIDYLDTHIPVNIQDQRRIRQLTGGLSYLYRHPRQAAVAGAAVGAGAGYAIDEEEGAIVGATLLGGYALAPNEVNRVLDWTYSKAFKPFALVTRIAYPIRVLSEEQFRMAGSGYESFARHPLSYIGWMVGRKGTLTEDDIIRMANENLLRGYVDDFSAAMNRRSGPVRLLDQDGGLAKLAGRTTYARGDKHFNKSWMEELYHYHQDPVHRQVALDLDEDASLAKTKEWFWNGGGKQHRQTLMEQGNGWEKMADKENSDAYIDFIFHEKMVPMTQNDPRLMEIIRTGKLPDGTTILRTKRQALSVDKKAEAYAQSILDEGTAPKIVPGDIMGGKAGQKGAYDRAVETMFTYMMGIPSDKLSRSPVWRQIYWRSVADFVAGADPEVGRRILTRAEAMLDDVAARHHSDARTIVDMIRDRVGAAGRTVERNTKAEARAAAFSGEGPKAIEGARVRSAETLPEEYTFDTNDLADGDGISWGFEQSQGHDPIEMYHATIDLDAVQKEGLKPASEVSMHGLAGDSLRRDQVSVTTTRARADEIAEGLKVASKAARNEYANAREAIDEYLRVTGAGMEMEGMDPADVAGWLDLPHAEDYDDMDEVLDYLATYPPARQRQDPITGRSEWIHYDKRDQLGAVRALDDALGDISYDGMEYRIGLGLNAEDENYAAIDPESVGVVRAAVKKDARPDMLPFESELRFNPDEVMIVDDQAYNRLAPIASPSEPAVRMYHGRFVPDEPIPVEDPEALALWASERYGLGGEGTLGPESILEHRAFLHQRGRGITNGDLFLAGNARSAESYAHMGGERLHDVLETVWRLRHPELPYGQSSDEMTEWISAELQKLGRSEVKAVDVPTRVLHAEWNAHVTTPFGEFGHGPEDVAPALHDVEGWRHFVTKRDWGQGWPVPEEQRAGMFDAPTEGFVEGETGVSRAYADRPPTRFQESAAPRLGIGEPPAGFSDKIDEVAVQTDEGVKPLREVIEGHGESLGAFSMPNEPEDFDGLYHVTTRGDLVVDERHGLRAPSDVGEGGIGGALDRVGDASYWADEISVTYSRRHAELLAQDLAEVADDPDSVTILRVALRKDGHARDFDPEQFELRVKPEDISVVATVHPTATGNVYADSFEMGPLRQFFLETIGPRGGLATLPPGTEAPPEMFKFEGIKFPVEPMKSGDLRPLTYEQIDTLAKARALEGTKALLYDLSERSQIFDILRFVAPFGDAWKEVITRWAAIMEHYPSVVRRFQQGLEGARDAGMFYTDPDSGEELFAIPGTEWLTEHLPGIGVPVPMEARVSGLNIAGNMLPGFGMVASIPATYFLPDEPQFDALRGLIFPFGEPSHTWFGQDVLEAIIPAWFDKLRMAMGDPTFSGQYNNMTMEIARYLYTTGDYGTDADEMRRMMDDAKEKAQWLSVFRAVAQNIAPSTPIPDYQILDKDGVLVSVGEVSKALRDFEQDDFESSAGKFIEQYGEKAYGIMQSMSSAITYQLPITAKQLEWERKNPELAKQYPLVYGFFAPFDPDGKMDLDAFQHQFDTKRRVPIDPEIWQRVVNDRRGRYLYDIEYNKVLKDYGAEDLGDVPDEEAQYLHDYQDWLKIKYDGYGSDVGKIGRADSEDLQFELRKTLKNEKMMATPAGKALKEYLAERDWVEKQAQNQGVRGWQQAQDTYYLREYLGKLQRHLRAKYQGSEFLFTFAYGNDVRDVPNIEKDPDKFNLHKENRAAMAGSALSASDDSPNAPGIGQGEVSRGSTDPGIYADGQPPTPEESFPTGPATIPEREARLQKAVDDYAYYKAHGVDGQDDPNRFEPTDIQKGKGYAQIGKTRVKDDHLEYRTGVARLGKAEDGTDVVIWMAGPWERFQERAEPGLWGRQGSAVTA